MPDSDAGRPRGRRHRKAWAAGVDLKDPLDGDRPSLRTAEPCVQASARVSETAARQRWSADETHVWLERLARRLGVDWEEFLRRQFFSLMHPNEIGALDPAIADVQLHTHRHHVPEERELFLREIADNRRALATCGLNPERLTHLLSERPVPAGLLAMVGGGWRRVGRDMCAGVGVEAAASAAAAQGATSDVEFEGWTSGLRHFLARSRVNVAL